MLLYYLQLHLLVVLVTYPIILRLLYYIQPFICTFNNNNDHNNNSNNNNDDDDNDDNENDNDDNENETFTQKFYGQ